MTYSNRKGFVHLFGLVILGLIGLGIFVLSQRSSNLTLPPLNINAQALPGFGILGDSNTDEYRADDNRAGGTQYAATTLSWIELLVDKRSFNVGTWGNWGGERRTGYKYNWARSGATTSSMVSSGQHTGLAAQIASGEVGYAFIYIGSNDFNTWNNTYSEVYSGAMSDAALQNKINSIIQNITTAVDTLKAAGNVKIVLINFADPGQSPDFITMFPNASGRARVTNAIVQINSGLSELGQSRQIVIADLYSYGATLISQVDQNGNLVIGGESISLTGRGSEPHNFRLGDSVGHPGTVAGGLLANYFLGALNTGYSLTLAPFTDSELLQNAGISAGSPTPSPTSAPTATPLPTATSVPTNTPIPTQTPAPTSTPTSIPTATPTAAPKTVRIVTKPNNSTQRYMVFDGIRENGTSTTEVTSSRFGYSSGWTSYPISGVNNSPIRYATTVSRTVTFTTTANTLDIMTVRHNQTGSFEVFVNNVKKVTYNAFAPTTQYVFVPVALQ